MSPEKRSQLSQIFKAYNQARGRARRLGELKQVDRLNKALGILQSADYYQSEKAIYHPSRGSCNCKDWQYRHAAKRQYTGACKHMLAESLTISPA